MRVKTTLEERLIELSGSSVEPAWAYEKVKAYEMVQKSEFNFIERKEDVIISLNTIVGTNHWSYSGYSKNEDGFNWLQALARLKKYDLASKDYLKFWRNYDVNSKDSLNIKIYSFNGECYMSEGNHRIITGKFFGASVIRVGSINYYVK